MPLISVIVPCYNVEKYIDRCLESIVGQTIGVENLEIILVNDASTDNTLDKLKQWEEKFPEQILVITYDENLRQGGARNIGLRYASAEYIGFVDADDWIEKEMYEELYSHTIDGQFDVVKGKFIRERFVGQKSIIESNRKDVSYSFSSIEGFSCYEIEETGNNGEWGSICTGLYRKACILENEIWFPEKIAYEDNYWSVVLQLYIRNIYIVDKVLYHYFVNTSSTVTTRNAQYHFDRLAIEIGILDEYEQRGCFDLFRERLEWNFVKKFYLNTWYIIFTRFDDVPDIFGFMKETILDRFPNYKENPNLEKCTSREKELLRLLEVPGELSVEVLQKVKEAYLKSF